MAGIIKHRQVKKIFLGLTAAVIVAAGWYPAVQAYAGTVYGRESWRGYFTNVYESWGGAVVLPELVPGQAIPDYVDTVPELLSLLQAANTSGNAQRRTGSAFIVYTMLGLNGANHDRNVSAASWTDLTNRLNGRQSAGRISWTGNVNAQINSYYNFSKDDAFFHTNPKNESGITISDDSGNVVYQILRRCANPMGDKTPGIPVANTWSVSTNTSVNKSTAKPGDTITWTHRVTNDGPNNLTKDVTYNYQNSGGLGGGSGTIGYLTAPGAKGVYAQDSTTHLVTQNDVGKTLCRSTSAQPKAWNDGDWVGSDPACVPVPYNYTLNPSTSVDHTDVVEPNTPLNVTPAAANTGPTKSRDTQWQLTQIIVQPGKTVPNAGGGTSSSAQPPCGNYFRSPPDSNCSTVASGNTVFSESGGTLAATPVTVGDLAVGTQICFAFSVQPYSSGSSNWRHSAPVCLTVGKKPKIQVIGGDLSVGKSFSGSSITSIVKTSVSVKTVGPTQNSFGSWIEYGIFATGSITGAASGSAYAGPTGMITATNFCKASMLSFTNATIATGCTGDIGHYTPALPIPDVAASFPGAGTVLPASVIPNDLFSAGSFYTGSTAGDLTIAASNLDGGKSGILKVDGTVTITGNQIYNPDNNGAKYTDVTQLPQLIIIANKIIINDNVKNVDAWLIANGALGVIETCNTGSATYILGDPSKLTSDKCNEKLIINGPIMAKQLWLRRTAGSGTGAASGDPAEVFNLRPDAYLWASARATGTGRIQTVHTTELPPRL